MIAPEIEQSYLSHLRYAELTMQLIQGFLEDCLFDEIAKNEMGDGTELNG